MKIHAILHGSHANGPEMRSVIWMRGCNLGCPGCVNKSTWDFDGGTEFTPEALACEIFSHCLPGTKGITISGGEPLHQAVSLLEFFRQIRKRRDGWSIGMFTGYSWEELVQGQYDLREPLIEDPLQMTDYYDKYTIWRRDLYPLLDFVKMGRWRRNLPPSDKPLCSSANQELILPTSRYTLADFPPNCIEWNIEADGMTTITGIPIRHS